jgi:tRNA G18 (ribose-2'-O)-methylase SpoU
MPGIIELTDVSAPELDVFARLTEAQLRNRLEPEKGVFIAESVPVIGLALDAGYEPLALLAERKQLAGQARELADRCGNSYGIPIYTGDDGLLAGLTGFAPSRGALCAMRRPRLPDAREVCVGARRIAVLDGISDSTNVGAIFRSAAALGMDAVLVTPTCCDPLLRRAVRVSMGTVFQVPWTRICGEASEWPERGIGLLRGMGFKTAAMALGGDSLPIDSPALAAEGKLAVILGAEGSGLSAEVIAGCDYTARIPMAHGVDSLNVAAAAAVAFWELRARL